MVDSEICDNFPQKLKNNFFQKHMLLDLTNNFLPFRLTKQFFHKFFSKKVLFATTIPNGAEVCVCQDEIHLK